MSEMIFAASTQRTIGVVIASVVAVGFLVYLLFNFRIGKREIGSEIEVLRQFSGTVGHPLWNTDSSGTE